MTQLVNNNNFSAETSKGAVLVDFYADWCRYCAMQMPILDQLSDQDLPANLKIVKVNVDESPEIAQKYNIMSIPALVFLKDGQLVSQVVGVHTADQIKQIASEIA